MKKLLFLLFFHAIIHSENITVFSHGIIDDKTQCERFQKAITTPILASNFADALKPSDFNFNKALYSLCSYFGKKVNRNAMFMGQKDDIEVIKRTINLVETNKNIILYGCSRGAATLVTYLGLHNPENITALILDACPSNIPETIQMALAKAGINPNWAETIFSYLFPQYDSKTAITPLQAIPTIKNKKLPILLLHSLEDTKVHYTNSLKLYKAFIDNGFTNVHICLISKGAHSYLLQNDASQGEYLQAVHSFYKKYGITYNQEFAQKDIDNYSLDKNTVENQIKDYEQDIIKTYQNSSSNNTYLLTSIACLSILYWYFKQELLQ